MLGAKKLLSNQKGDTLIEVSIAIGILGLVLTSVTVIVNRSLLTVSSAIERTAIQSQISSQSELLRYVFDHPKTNKDTVDVISRMASRNLSSLGGSCSVGKGGFYLYLNEGDKINNKTNSPVLVGTVNKTDDNHLVADGLVSKAKIGVDDRGHSNGIWIESVKTPTVANFPGRIDFYIRACWTPYSSRKTGQGRIELVTSVYFKG